MKGDVEIDIHTRIDKAALVIHKVWASNTISVAVKLQPYMSNIVPTAIYASEAFIVKLQYQQLLEERWNGHYDEQRVTLLKAQIMQLERQVVLLTEGLSSRAAQMLEMENVLDLLNERFRSLLRFESPTSEVPVSRAELMQLIGTCQALQKRLQKRQTAANVKNLSMMWLMSGRNLIKQPVTLLDLCYGRMDNLNLQHVDSPLLHPIGTDHPGYLLPGHSSQLGWPLAAFVGLQN
ncbi:uncharacterized protein LOC121276786 [Carcharodon carcharias]|uniref:uncharacterized protein LOC121276786 n=1 Tax=Carcharodon carcharias TaxID=13397 RepID=UPI001B7F00E2|nr:uncharacterized protein LOC121276786 [Carcharodon carcharias]